MSHSNRFLERVKSTLEDRRDEYGDPTLLFSTIAKRWSLTLGHPLTPTEVILCMMDLKIARLAANPKHDDSLIDMVGYAACLKEVLEGDSGLLRVAKNTI